MTNPNSIQNIVDRVKAASTAKLALDTGGVTDPSDRGEASAPTDPPIVGLPPNKPPAGGVKADDQTLQPVGTGEAVPSTESQNAKDEAATSPTDALAKIAGNGEMAARLARITAAAKSASAPAPASTTAPAPAPAAATPAGSTTPKNASETPTNFDQDTLAKLGSLALSTERGQAYMLELVEQDLGAKEAHVMIADAVAAHYAFGKTASATEQQAYNAWCLEEQQKAAAFQQRQQAAAELEHILANSSPAEAAQIRKIAAMHQWAEDNLKHPLLKAAFAQGMQEGAEDVDAMEAGQELPTGEEELAPEDIQMLIQQAVEEGKLPPEVAMQLMDQLAQGASPDGGTGSEGEMDSEMTAAASLVS